MKRNEKTSPRIASMAAKLVATKHEFDFLRDDDDQIVSRTQKYAMVSEGEWKRVIAVCMSCLTQAPDRLARKAAHDLAQRTFKPKPKPKPARSVKRSNYIAGSGQKFGRSP